MSSMAYGYDVEAIREAEYPMMQGSVYLDHGGTTIYAKSLIERASKDLLCNLYGNPHSASKPAQLSGVRVDEIRQKTLRFFNADPQHFDLIFTANATASMKLVAETFRDLAVAGSTSGAFWYGYHKDAHTSLVGIREFTKYHHCFTSDHEVDTWLEHERLHGHSADMPALFAFPGQSNMTGRRLPLSWPGRLRGSLATNHRNTWSLLDAAAFATTAPLDFIDPDIAPDFTAVSFYKIFGFPDLGGLIVRRQSGHILAWRKYFGGGTVDMVTVLHEATFQRKTASIHDGCEDGTVPFHSILALGSAIDVHRELYGPECMKAISAHTSALIRRLYTGLSGLRHNNGLPVCNIYHEQSTDPASGVKAPGCIIYQDESTESSSTSKSECCKIYDEGAIHPYSDPKKAGATIAFNVTRPDGSVIPHTMVETLANSHDIYIRSGGLCNPGGIVSHLKIEPWQMKGAWSGGFRCSGNNVIIHGKTLGVARASLGAMTTTRDIDALVNFVHHKFAGSVVRDPLADVSCNARNGPRCYKKTHVIGDLHARLQLSSVKESMIGGQNSNQSTSQSDAYSDIFQSFATDSLKPELSLETTNPAPQAKEPEPIRRALAMARMRRLTSHLNIKKAYAQDRRPLTPTTLTDMRELFETQAMQKPTRRSTSTETGELDENVETPPSNCSSCCDTDQVLSTRIFNLICDSNGASEADTSLSAGSPLAKQKRKSMKFWKPRAD